MADVEVEGVSLSYGAVNVLHDISFSVEEGEFLTFLGPSGCGKSTTLAAIAGLLRPDQGRIVIRGRTVFDSARKIFVDARFRNLGFMFQSYALWPNMTVYGNLKFPLDLRRIRGLEAKSRIDDVLDLVDMAPYAHRYPHELSGGQQQRVALARTLVYQPELLLLDEPLSNLDASQRERTRLWLFDLQRRTGLTTIYVTHDQIEALSLSHRIIVMNNGRVAQIGSPGEIYERPRDLFVAEFVGGSNLLHGKMIDRSDDRIRITLGNEIELIAPAAADTPIQRDLSLSIRPERILINADAAEQNRFSAKLVSRSYLGARDLLVLEINGQTFRVECGREDVGDMVTVSLPPDAIRIFARTPS